MKKHTIIVVLLCTNAILSFAQGFVSVLASGTALNVACDNFKQEGIAPLLQNKTWQMVKMYADSIPMNDSIPQSYQFVFKADSLQNNDTLFITRKVVGNDTLASARFLYTINQDSSIISLFGGHPVSLQQTFTVVCLTPGHLVFQFNESGVDQNGNPISNIHMEYRFLVDYTWENSVAGSGP